MGDRSSGTAMRHGRVHALIALLVASTAIVGVALPASADTGPPSRPTGLTISNDGLIQWDPPSAEDAASVTGYHLTADDGTDTGVAVDLPPDATSYQIVVVPEEMYRVSLVATSDSGDSTRAWWGLCLCQAPDVPTDFRLGTLPNGHYGVSWVPPADWGGPKHRYDASLDGYAIYPTMGAGSGDRDYVDLSNQYPRKHSLRVIAANDLYKATPVVVDADVPLPPRLPGPIALINVEDAEHQVNPSIPPADWLVTFAADDGGGMENVRFAIDGFLATSYTTTPTTALVTYPYIGDALPRFGPHVLTVWGENERGVGPVTAMTIMRGTGPLPFQHVSVTSTGLVSWSEPLLASGVHEAMTSQIINVDGSGIAQVSPDVRTYQLTGFSTGATSSHVITVIAYEDAWTNPAAQSPSPPFTFTLDGIQPDSVAVSRPLADRSLLVRWHQPHPDSLLGYVVTATAISNDDGRPYVAATVSRPGSATAATLTGLPTDQPVSIHVEARSAAGTYAADGSGQAWDAVPTTLRLYRTHIVGTRGKQYHAAIWLRRGDKTFSGWLPGARGSLYVKDGTKWRFVAHAVTDVHGKAFVNVRKDRSAYYRLTFPAQRVGGVRYLGSSGTLSVTLH